MKYIAYGIYLGAVLTMLVFTWYGFYHHVDMSIVMPYVFICMLLYFFLLGFYISHKTCSFKEGLKAGLVAGAVSMFFIAAAYFLAHNVFFYYDTVTEPEKLAGFHASGLLSMQRYLIYDSIRSGVIGLIVGSVFAAFCAGVGSYTASNIQKSQVCRNRNIVSQ